jgi:hypothetical protein
VSPVDDGKITELCISGSKYRLEFMIKLRGKGPLPEIPTGRA